MLVGVATRQYGRSLEPTGPDDPHAGHEQERRESSVRREDRGAARRLAIDGPRCARSRGAPDRRRPHRRALHRRRPRHRSHGRQTRARPLGRLHGECGRLSKPLGRSAEPWPAHRSQPLGHPRWLEGAAQSGDADVRVRGPDSPLSGPQAAGTSWSICRRGSGPGSGRSSPAPTSRRRSRRRAACCRIWRDASRTAIRVPRRASAKDSTRRSPSSRSACPIASGSRSRRPTRSKA